MLNNDQDLISPVDIEVELVSNKPTPESLEDLLCQCPVSLHSIVKEIRDLQLAVFEAQRQFQLKLGYKLIELQMALGPGHGGDRKSKSHSETFILTLEDIAERLGFSRATAFRWMGLAKTHRDAKIISEAALGEVVNLKAGPLTITASKKQNAARVYASIEDGSTPVNRAAPALNGAVYGNDEPSKQKTNHAENFKSAVIKLKNSMCPKHWRESESAAWSDGLSELIRIMDQAPDEVRREILNWAKKQ